MKECINSHHDCQGDGATCVTSTGMQCADIQMPISLNPYACLGTVKTQCCGEPTVTLHKVHCGGKSDWEIVVTQSVCYKIPIEYGIEAESGEVSIHCKSGGCTQHR